MIQTACPKKVFFAKKQFRSPQIQNNRNRALGNKKKPGRFLQPAGLFSVITSMDTTGIWSN